MTRFIRDLSSNRMGHGFHSKLSHTDLLVTSEMLMKKQNACGLLRIHIVTCPHRYIYIYIYSTINKMEATNPNVFTFLDYECKPLQ